MAEKKFETSAWVLKSLDVENIEITKVNGNNCVKFRIRVNTGSKSHVIVKTYTDFFDFKCNLENEFSSRKDVHFPTLRAHKWFLQTRLLLKDALTEKKKRSMQDFCKDLLLLPRDVLGSSTVKIFFENTSTTNGSSNTHTEVAAPAIVPTGASSVCENVQHNLNVVSSPFVAGKPGQVSLQPGYIVDVLQKSDKEWCFVHVSDTHEQGWVPQSILKPLFPVKKDCNTVISPATTSSSSSPTKFRAVVSYVGKEAEEISYSAGEVVEVVENVNEKQVRIRHGGQIGIASINNFQPMLSDELDQEINIDPYYITLNRQRLMSKARVSNRISQELLQTVLPQEHYVVPAVRQQSSPDKMIAVSCEENVQSTSSNISDKVNKRNDGIQNISGTPDIYTQVKITPKKLEASSQLQSVSGKSETTSTTQLPVKTAEPVYQVVIPKKKNQPIIEEPELNYAEIEVIKMDGAPKPIIRDAVIYSEVIPIALPPRKANKEFSTENYANVRLRHKDNYENTDLFNAIQQSIQEKSYRVSRDHKSKHLAHTSRPVLDVKAGELVQVELVEGGNCFCVVTDDDLETREGWLPRDILEEITHSTDGIEELNIDIEVPVDQLTLTRQSNTGQVAITKQITTGQQAVVQQTTTGQPAIIRQSTTGQPAVTKQSTPSQPAVTKQSTTGQPAVTKQSTTGQPAVTKQSTTGQPAATKITTIGQPAVTKQSTTGQPAITKQTPADKLAISKQTPNPPPKSTTIDNPVIKDTWAQAFSSYNDTTNDLLSFEEGDWARVLSQDESGWWLVELGEKKGWVPGNFWTICVKASDDGEQPPPPIVGERRSRASASTPSFVQCPWYYNSLGRVECEQLLLEHGHTGNYLLRAGTSKNVDLCISLLDDNRVRHFAIKRFPDGQVLIASHHFKSVEKMIKYFSSNPICQSESNEPRFLVEPLIFKQAL